ncbi:biotin--[acetyl-CoA-carboxylase] ligase [Acuticoccus sp. 2012]|uniref:biotin--[biotin carboxyl-carrier protein] ligase n=1 Tax=Acuticoccus mangrovi TaxID=2796142 RepID=A0A934MI12_9HYPH|nr:biotin--[acetyl-CoA-carboxylase] ligase [Acuticoccus mangrovi]
MSGEARSPAVIRLGDVGSTNDEAMQRLVEDGRPVWVIAERQLSGRGRRGRPWVSEAGNLYASFATSTTLSGDAFGFLPLAVAVAVADAIEETTGLSPQLKWPNDVLIEGRKVCGILIEARMSAAEPHRRRVVIGIGVNIAHHPEDVAATNLCAHHPQATPEDVWIALCPILDATIDILSRPGGLTAMRERWLARSVGIGGEVAVRFDDETREGRFVGLDDSGRLILDRDGSREPIAAGDVFVRSSYE